jgi:hypothetical protein
MVGEMKMIMILSGPGQAQVSKRCRAQCSSEWQRYVRFYEKVDAYEIKDQLLNCLDKTIQLFVYRDLGSNVDTATQADLLRVIELLVVEEVDKDVYENLDDEVVVNMEHTVVVVDEEHAVMVVPKVDMLPLSYRKRGGQFSLELEDEVYPMVGEDQSMTCYTRCKRKMSE